MERFIEKQKIYHNIALEELKNGHKESHWMWYIFPQIKGLGYSYNAVYYGINNYEEAKLYWQNDYLRNNYLQLCQVLLDFPDKSASDIFGFPDDLKLKSSLTLFYKVSNEEIIYKTLEKFFNSKFDEHTLELLNK